MPSAPVELRVGGQTYRVVASAEEGAVRRYAQVVNEKLAELLGPGRPSAPQSMLLVAISLVHELELERERRRVGERRSRELLRRVLERIDQALESVDEDGQPLPPAPFAGRSTAAQPPAPER